MHSTVYQIAESCRQDVTKYCNVVITWSATLQEVVMARFSPSRRHLQYSLISGLSRLSVGRMERGKNKAPSFHHSIYNFPWGLYGGVERRDKSTFTHEKTLHLGRLYSALHPSLLFPLSTAYPSMAYVLNLFEIYQLWHQSSLGTLLAPSLLCTYTCTRGLRQN